MLRRVLAAVATPLLLAGTLTACGGGAPTDASKKDFCEFHDADPDLSGLDEDSSNKEIAEVLKEELDKLVEDAEEIGTPEDIPDDAREGFEINLETSKELDESDIEKAVEDETDPFKEELSKDEKKKVEAYEKWSDEYCGSDSEG